MENIDAYTFAAISLVVQLVVFALLLIGYGLKRKQKFPSHGTTMLTAVVLHTVTILVVMIPSLVLGFSAPGALDFTNPVVVIAIVHAVIGTLVWFLGIYLVAAWHFSAAISKCFHRRRIMRYTIILWLVEIALGVIIYISLYVAGTV